MATTLKLRRGTTAQHSTFTGAVGEVTADTDKDTLVVHDGVTAGGFPVMSTQGPQTLDVNSSSDALRITQTGTGNALVVEDNTNPDSTPFVVGSNGAVGIQTSPSSNDYLSFGVAGTQPDALTAGTINGIALRYDFPTTATSNQRGVYITLNGGNSGSAYTTAASYGVQVDAYQTGTNQTLTNCYAFYCGNISSATDGNYGFYSAINSGTNRYNFYAAGTAENYFAGGVTIGRTAVTSPASTDGNVFSGTYTPTQVSTNTNVDSVTFGACQYMRVGDVVTVSGQITVDPTASTTATTVKFSLPIASNFGSSRQLGGTGVSPTTSFFGSSPASFLADITNDCVEMRFTSASTVAIAHTFSFTYRVI